MPRRATPFVIVGPCKIYGEKPINTMMRVAFELVNIAGPTVSKFEYTDVETGEINVWEVKTKYELREVPYEKDENESKEEQESFFEGSAPH